MQAKGVCAHCNATELPINEGEGCSDDVVARGGQLHCGYCCPDNYTEDYYHDHPGEYSSHPWTFLVQTTFDANSDSCAAKHYHATMLAHGGRAELGSRCCSSFLKSYACGAVTPLVSETEHCAASRNGVCGRHVNSR